MKPELLLKLSKDNVLTDKEKESLDSILQSIGILNPKNCQYELQKDVMLNEVKEDWPFYSQPEKTIVKRNISKVKQSTNNQVNESSSNQPKAILTSSSSYSSLNTLNSSLNQSGNKSSAFSIPTKPNNDTSKKISPIKNDSFGSNSGHSNNNNNSSSVSNISSKISPNEVKPKYRSVSPSSELFGDTELNSNSKKLKETQFESSSFKRIKPNTGALNGVKPNEQLHKKSENLNIVHNDLSNELAKYFKL